MYRGARHTARLSPKRTPQISISLSPRSPVFLYHQRAMQQYGNSPEQAIWHGGIKRDWVALEEHAHLPDEDAKRACTRWPETLETEPVPAMSLSNWGRELDFEGATHQPETVNFVRDSIYFNIGANHRLSTQTISRPLPSSILSWPDSVTASPALETGNGAGYPSYDTNPNLAQFVLPSFTLAEIPWSEPDVRMETEEILQLQDLDYAFLENKSYTYNDLGIECNDNQNVGTIFDQAISLPPQSVALQSALPSASQRDGLTSDLVSPWEKETLPGSAPVLGETGTGTSGGYTQMEPRNNSQKDLSQENATRGSAKTFSNDQSLGRDDLLDFAVDANTEVCQMPPSKSKEFTGHQNVNFRSIFPGARSNSHDSFRISAGGASNSEPYDTCFGMVGFFLISKDEQLTISGNSESFLYNQYGAA